MTLRFDILTLFPQLIAPLFEHGINRRAIELGQLQVHYWNPRDHAQGTYKRVDDRPFGGGPGMVMMAEPLSQCLQAAQAHRVAQGHGAGPVVLLSPLGQPIKQASVNSYAQGRGFVLVCGRYEGIDQRFIDAHVDTQISLGDFVLSGGEIAAMALLDAIARLLPGVLHDPGSHEQDSFNTQLNGLLDCPHYTRPEVWQGPHGDMPVPEVLTSGHHERIARHRREQSLRTTAQHRPDLLQAALDQGHISRADQVFLNGLPRT
jgi:tRNA (guanine37-N1)-methyltransferase